MISLKENSETTNNDKCNVIFKYWNCMDVHQLYDWIKKLKLYVLLSIYLFEIAFFVITPCFINSTQILLIKFSCKFVSIRH